jgi:membrane protein
MLLHTIERAFNHLWQVQPRPWLARLGLYALMMLVWPLLLGGVALAVSFAVSSSLGWFGDLGLAEHWVLKGSSLLLLALFFSVLYLAVPNARVRRRAALLGGVFAALAFAAMQKVFEYYLVSSALLKSIYGAFAAFPVFLLWLHVSWAIVLLGGLLAARGSGQSRR